MYVGNFDRLEGAISEAAFFSLEDHYGADEDAEQVSLTVTNRRQSKTVKMFDFSDAPVALWRIVTLADGIAANLSWENPNQPKPPKIVGPLLIRNVEPTYTKQALAAKLEGSAWVAIEVGPDGKVSPEHMFVIQGLGMGLDEQAIEAVKQWTFTPATQDGKPISMATTVQVPFRLP